jgi:hypothetical protein
MAADSSTPNIDADAATTPTQLPTQMPNPTIDQPAASRPACGPICRCISCHSTPSSAVGTCNLPCARTQQGSTPPTPNAFVNKNHYWAVSQINYCYCRLPLFKSFRAAHKTPAPEKLWYTTSDTDWSRMHNPSACDKAKQPPNNCPAVCDQTN